LLNTYSEHKLPALAFRSTATADQINVFTDLVEDATYVELSKNTGLLGSPADGDHNFALIQRLVRTLSDKPLFKPVVFVAEKALQLRTHIPLPVGKLLEWLLPRPYLHEHRCEHAARPQLSHDVKSVATREHDVEDDAAIPSVERTIQRVITRLGLDRAIALLAEGFAQKPPQVAVIFYHQNLHALTYDEREMTIL
jgi:hypothetical protein